MYSGIFHPSDFQQRPTRTIHHEYSSSSSLARSVGSGPAIGWVRDMLLNLGDGHVTERAAAGC